MYSLFKARLKHGYQAIKSVEKAQIHTKFRGLPKISKDSVSPEMEKLLLSLCPTGAISNNPLSIDLGKCIFCGACEDFVEDSPIKFTNFHKIFGFKREDLIVTKDKNEDFFINLRPDRGIVRNFKRSFKIRSLSTGGCSACELELSASFNVNFDIGRFGIDIVASPRHADALLITGPITKNMAEASIRTWESISEPKLIILFGACAISKGIFMESSEIDRSILDKVMPVLYIPGCPAHPLTFIAATKRLIGWGDNEP